MIHRDQNYTNDEQDLFAKLQTFLSLHKNAQYSNREVMTRVMDAGDNYAKKRANIFLFIYFKVKRAYEKYLDEERKYDFADMINLATLIVREVPECVRAYRYILLDEVQDLSRNRYLLVREILRKNPGCKLFAVGDDWQSIYRFTGSDLTLIQEFEKTFGLKTRRSLIETTHRFGQPTIKISCDFIQKNPAQSHKNVSNKKAKPTPIRIILNAPSLRDNDVDSLNTILLELIKTRSYDELSKKELQIISRYNHDIKRIQGAPNIETKIDQAAGTAKVLWYNPRDSSQVLNLEYCSMHKSKGITRDIVIVLNMNAGLTGMPATRESDPILDALLAKEDNFPFAEERRLFYVAITRAREETFLIANRKNPSPFIFEISDEIKSAYGKLCPKCQTGELILKHGKHGDFYYCSNYRYGCNYLKK